MGNLQGYDSAIFALLLLFTLAILTFETCRRYGVRHKEGRARFLFHGTTALHAMASNAGSSFSVTYLFGGLILATLYLGRAVMIPLAVGILGSWLFLRAWLRKIDPTITHQSFIEQSDNVLMLYVRSKLKEDRQLKSFAWMYTINYVMLLAVELAIGRILLVTLFPRNEIIGSGLLAILCLVVATYLYAGGFRAVLVSDVVQGLVIVLFVATLVYLGVSGSGESVSAVPPVNPLFEACGAVGLGLIALSWTIAGLDFSSRLNFGGARLTRTVEKGSFIKDSHLLTGSILIVSAWAGSQSTYIPLKTMEPFEFFRKLNSSFFESSPVWVGMIYLVGIFCMLFTTIDTHLLSAMQAAHYRQSEADPKPQILRTLLIATLVAIAIPVEWLSIFSITAASMIIVPFIVLLGRIFSNSVMARLLPTYGLGVMLISWVILPTLFLLARPPEVAQFAIPLLVAIIAMATSIFAPNPSQGD